MNLVDNERSWAAEVISQINAYSAIRQLEIRRAGGEHTLKQLGSTSLFPDVLLFGGEDGSRVRHGWELKYPDTPVDDPATVQNAIRKAERLGVNSFLIWNVIDAHLYVKDSAGHFFVEKTWGPLPGKVREHVAGLRTEWVALLEDILEDLNRFFALGTLQSASPAFLQETFFSDFLNEYCGVTSDSLRQAANRDAKVEAEFNLWWHSSSEYLKQGKPQPLDFTILAQTVLVGWINRLLFCHYLKGFRQESRAVDTIAGDMSLDKGISVLDSISSRCDFMQVFRREAGAHLIPEEAWEGLKGLNAFLTDFAVDGIPQTTLRLALEGALNAAKRKVRGQYTTPEPLADLVVAIGMEDRTGALLDPCSGTGTIPKAALLARVSRGQSHATALAAIWASDRFQFPLQFTTMALAEPQAMRTPIRAFRQDVFSLNAAQSVELANPDDGSVLRETLPRFSTIVSNLPFVRFETLAQHDAGLRQRFRERVPGIDLDAKSDLFAYIILYLKDLLTDDGRVCVIVSNAWLGTEWGATFRRQLEPHFEIDVVAVSGAGRWFNNADVVTTVLCLRRRLGSGSGRPTRFVTTMRALADWDLSYVSGIATALHGGDGITSTPEGFRVRSYTPVELEGLEPLLIGWPGLFAQVGWIRTIDPWLVRSRDILSIGRGERRGWDAMFFPDPGHGIESEYIKPVLISGRGNRRLQICADGEAFCCSRSLEELHRLGHTGALNWIRSFQKKKNSTGEPLTESLQRANHYWYEMKADATADLAVAMNPEDRIFVARLTERSFVNQRLIRMSARAGGNLDLLHALLNSSLSVFFIESSGFGRGLGALDITPTKLKEGMKLVDPARISAKDSQAIIRAFTPLLSREALPLDEEMRSSDRSELDAAVLGSIGMSHVAQEIRDAVVELYGIRKAVKH